MRPALAEALRLAHDRLDDDSDAYADEDLLGQLVEAIEAEPPGQSIREDLTRVADFAAHTARELVDDGSITPALSALRDRADVVRAALEALRLLPVDEGRDDRAEVTEAEAEAIADVGRAFDQLTRAGDFLTSMHGEFTSAQSPVADRWAARIASVLAELPDYEPELPDYEPDRAEPKE